VSGSVRRGGLLQETHSFVLLAWNLTDEVLAQHASTAGGWMFVIPVPVLRHLGDCLHFLNVFLVFT